MLRRQQITEIERRFGNLTDMDDHYIVAVDGDGSEDETEAILVDLRHFLGPDWLCEWAGSGNTDADGCSTEDISVSPKLTYNYKDLSYEGRSWINDLRRADDETGFPAINPERMTEADRDRLADYLEFDDGSLSESNMEFSRSVAKEVRGLQESDRS